MTKYFVLSSDDARRFLRERDGDEPFLLADLQKQAGFGDEIDESAFDGLLQELDMLKRQLPVKLKRRDRAGGAFERQAAEHVHQAMLLMSNDVKGNPEFWIWLAVAKFAKIVEWRFGADDRQARAENYGVGKPAENLLYRLWLRGDIGYLPGHQDPYELVREGDQDLWRSHIIRQGYGNGRAVVHALLRLQAGKLGRKQLDVDGIRELAKRLRRIRANVIVELLSPASADALVLEMCGDL